MTAFKEQLDCIQCFNAFSFKDSCSFLTSCQWQPEASPIPTTKLKQPTLHWAQVVSVTAGLASDLDWPALAALWNAFFLLTCRASSANSFFMILMKLYAVEQVFCEMILGLCRRSVLSLSVSVFFVLIGLHVSGAVVVLWTV